MNGRARHLAERMVAEADRLRVAVHTLENGTRVIDAGHHGSPGDLLHGVPVCRLGDLNWEVFRDGVGTDPVTCAG